MKTASIAEMLNDFKNGTYDFTDNGKCRPSNSLDLSDTDINGVKVISFYGVNDKHRSLWNCKCHCGKEFIAVGTELKRGKLKSCGCLNKTINGLYKSRLYGIHHCMMCRCYTKSASGYEYYGGRGIKVCNEWHDFLTFYNWSIDNGYSDDLSIDRIDTNGDYEPSNCRWATWKEQANNKRDSRFITYNGKTMTLSQWAEYIGIDERTLYKRFSMGWSVEKALTYPVNEKFSRKGSRRVKNF